MTGRTTSYAAPTGASVWTMAIALVAAAGLILTMLPGVASAQEEPTLQVDPDEGLNPDGDTVEVQGSGFEGEDGEPLQVHFGTAEQTEEGWGNAEPVNSEDAELEDGAFTVEGLEVESVELEENEATGVFVAEEEATPGQLQVVAFHEVAFSDDEPAPEEAGTLTWGILSAFVDEVEDEWTESDIELSEGVERDEETGEFIFPLEEAEYDAEAETGEFSFEGSVQFTGTDSTDVERDVTIAAPHVAVEEGEDGAEVVSVELAYQHGDEDPIDAGRVDFGDLDFEEVEWVSDEEVLLRLADVPGELTQDAEDAFANYGTGNDLDELTVEVTEAEDDPEDPRGPDGVERFSGTGRIETAISVSQGQYDDGAADAVVLARADEYADALSGTPVAVEANAPLLITSSDDLVDIVADEIQRVLGEDGGEVILLGGTEALDESVEGDLTEAGYDTERVSGPSRVETAIEAAEWLGNPDELLVTTGYDYPDALTSGAAAANLGAVLLTQPDEAHPEVDAYLEANADANAMAIGGPAARAYEELESLVGETREGTAILVAEHYKEEPAYLGVARRDDFPDALAGGAYIGRVDGPLLLTYTDQLDDEFIAYFEENSDTVEGAAIFGGTDAISEDVEDQLRDLLDIDEDDDDNDDDDDDDDDDNGDDDA